MVVASYDNNNRLISKALSLASGIVGATSLAYGYDGLDRLTSADSVEASWSALIVRTYNTLGKIQTEKQILDGYNSGNGRTITYDWDVEGQKTGVTYPVGGAVLSYTRDALDRVDKISRGGTQVVDYTFSGSRVLKKAYPGSHGQSTYDGAGRLTSVHHKDTSSGNTLAQFVYGWDKSHQVTSQDKVYYDDVQNTRITTDTVDKGDQYAYDGAKRLVTTLRGVPSAKIDTAMATNITNNDYADLVEYVYDPTGNRTTRKIDGSNDKLYAYNKVNEMTTEGGSTREYNANGAMTGTQSLSTVHGYDHADHYAKYFSGVVDSPTYVWHYDALGRLVARRKVSGTGGAADVRMYFDGEHDIEVVQWDGSTESHRKTRVYGERIDELLEYTDISADPDEVYYAHTDLLGSVQVMVDDTGAIAESYRYSDWGETRVVDSSFAKLGSLGSNIGNFIRYTGRERAIMATVGDDWYFYRARMYRPDSGRFGQRDKRHATNAYGYVGANPAGASDPSGLTQLSVISQVAVVGASGARDEPVVPPQTQCPDHTAPGCAIKQTPGCGKWDDDGNGNGPICDCVKCTPSQCSEMKQAFELAKEIHSGLDERLNGVGVTCGPVDGQYCAETNGSISTSVDDFTGLEYIDNSQWKDLTITMDTSKFFAGSECNNWGNAGPLSGIERVMLHEMGHALGALGSDDPTWLAIPGAYSGSLAEQMANNFSHSVVPLSPDEINGLGGNFNSGAGMPPGHWD